MKMRPFGRLIPAPEARRRLLAAVRPIGRTEEIPLAEAVGRVSAGVYRARAPVPAFRRATWDGYAFASRSSRSARATSPARFAVVGEIFAEDSLGRSLRPGEAVAIATGGALPRGADTVLIFEEARVDGSSLEVPRYVRPGERIADPGEDYPRGATVAARGQVLTPAALGGLASIGRTRVQVYARPRVSVVPNGNELIAPGRPLARGKIHESNNLALAGLISGSGGVARLVPPVPDDPARIERAIRAELPRSDLVLVTGGSSVGEHDYLAAIFPRLGRLLFHGIAVRPGKPTLATRAGRTLVVGMPGHPTSCLSNGFWLLLPVLRKLAHLPGSGLHRGTVTVDRPYTVPTAGLSTVVPFHVAGGHATPTFHDSSAITSLAGVNAYAILPPGAVQLVKGSIVTVNYLPAPIAVPPID